MKEEIDDPFGQDAHNRHCPKHSRKYGHFCWEYDGLWICRDCEEWLACHCFKYTIFDRMRKAYRWWQIARELKKADWNDIL